MSLLPIILMARKPFTGAVNTVFSAALPNIMLLLVIIANIAWWREAGGFSFPGGSATFPFAENLWQEALLLVGIVIAVDIAVISLFARRWRKRRWDRKPAAVEASTRYFNG